MDRSSSSTRTLTSRKLPHLLFVLSHSMALKHNFINSVGLANKFRIKHDDNCETVYRTYHRNEHRICNEHEQKHTHKLCKILQTPTWARARASATDTLVTFGRTRALAQRRCVHKLLEHVRLVGPFRAIYFDTAHRRRCLLVFTLFFLHTENKRPFACYSNFWFHDVTTMVLFRTTKPLIMSYQKNIL